MQIPHQPHLRRSCWHIRREFDRRTGTACILFGFGIELRMHSFCSGRQPRCWRYIGHALAAILPTLWHARFLFCQHQHRSRGLMCHFAAHDSALVLVRYSSITAQLLPFCYSFSLFTFTLPHLSHPVVFAHTTPGSFPPSSP